LDPLVASPGVSPDVAAAFESGGQTAVAAYQQKVASDQAAADAVTEKQDQIDAEDRAQKNALALLAYKHMQSAADTKAQNAVEWNQSHWNTVTGQYLGNLAEKQANAETWLDPKNVNNITPQSAQAARDLVNQVQGIYQHVANNTPVDFSTYHEPADVINAKPLTAQFTPQFTPEYLADLDAKKQKDTDQATHTQLENQKLQWEVDHPKQAHPSGGVDARWYQHEDYKEHVAEQKSYDKDFAKASNSFLTNYNRLRSATGGIPYDASVGAPLETLAGNTDDAAADLSGNLSSMGSAHPEYAAISALWNEGKASHNGLSTYKDIDNYMSQKAQELSGHPESPEYTVFNKLHGFVYGGDRP
jgi:hypothetical protein